LIKRQALKARQTEACVKVGSQKSGLREAYLGAEHQRLSIFVLRAMIKSKWRTTLLIARIVLHVWLMRFLGLAAFFLRLQRAIRDRKFRPFCALVHVHMDAPHRTRGSASLPRHARGNAGRAGTQPIGANLSESRLSVPALHLFKAVQTETVRLHINASASFEYLDRIASVAFYQSR